jgi:HlyD family secretion protein
MKERLYRKAALQHLAVSERLDTAVQVVNPASSLVIVAAAATIVAAVVWATVGRVPSRVYGEGLLLRQGSIVDVTSMADGQIDHVVARVGDLVKENDAMAYVEQPELKKQHSLLQAKLGELTTKSQELAQLDDRGAAVKHAVFDQQKVATHYALRETKKQLAFFEQKLKSDNELLARGLTTPAAVAETRQKVVDLHDVINTRQAEGRNIAFSILEQTRTREQRRFDLAMEVDETKRLLEELDKRIDTQSVVRAKSAGRVIEVKLTDGDAVARGRPIATLEVAPAGAPDLIAEVYLPAQDGKRVKPGMTVKLAPSVVKPEEDGYLEGTIVSVSPFPVSQQSILRVVRNESLVTALLKEGPVYEALVHVTPDASTPSGLRWSNGRGPTLEIASGTPVRGLVTVRTRRPIELVIPAVERILSDAPAEVAER